MMTYALGRGLESTTAAPSSAIVAQAAKQGNHFSALVTGIVTSDPFLKRERSRQN